MQHFTIQGIKSKKCWNDCYKSCSINGNKFVFVGYDQPWDFKKGSQAFSRNLEDPCEFMYCRNKMDFSIGPNVRNKKNTNEKSEILPKVAYQYNWSFIFTFVFYD